MKHGSSKALLRSGSDALADVEPGKGPVDVLVVDVELSGMLLKRKETSVVVVLWTMSMMVSVSRLITAPSSCTSSSEIPSKWKKRKPKVN